MDTKTLKNLFVHRLDAFAQQNNSGTYTRITSALIDSLLDSHLAGKRTIGVYHLNTDNTVKFSCIDIDINKTVWNTASFNYEDWKSIVIHQVQEIKTALAKYNISSYTEFSGFKGAHVWYFFKNPVPAIVAKDMNTVMLSDVKLINSSLHIEVFPKQETVNKEGFGNLIKLPCGIHKKSGDFSYFIDDVMGKIAYLDKQDINNIISPIGAIYHNCIVMHEIKKQAKLGHLTHNQRLALGYILINVPGGEKELRHILEIQDDYNEGKTNYQINNIKSKKYKPINCLTLQSSAMDNLCPNTCSNIKSGKSPIAFYYRHVGKVSNEIINGQTKTIINNLDEFNDNLEQYERHDSKYFYKTKAGKTLLANFVVNITDQIMRDNGLEIKTTMEGNIIKGTEIFPFKIDAKFMSQVEKLKAEIYNSAGNENLFCDNYIHLQHAINKYTKSNKILIKEIFGYDGSIDNPFRRYLSPSIIVDKESIRENEEILVDLSDTDKAKYLDLYHIKDDNEYQSLVNHINKDLLILADFGIMHGMLAHTFCPIIEPWLYKKDRTRYILFLRGGSGEGKSFLAQSMCHFYGKNFLDYAQWNSTPYYLAMEGFNFKDALYLIDDWKKDVIKDMSNALGLLQAYADRSSRGRLNKNADVKKSKPIRGTLLITGEDFAEGQSSVLARTITLNYENKVKNIPAGLKVLDRRNEYSAVTTRYIHYILNYPNKQEIVEYQKNLHNIFYKFTIGKHNDVRIARNLSLLGTSYHYFCNWFWDQNTATKYEKQFLEYLKSQANTLIRLSSIQRPAEKFWYMLKDLLAMGKLRLQSSYSADIDKNVQNIPIIGFHSDTEIYLILDTALREVEKYLRFSGESLSFSHITIIEELAKSKYIKQPKPIKRRFNKQQILCYPVDPKKLLG